MMNNGGDYIFLHDDGSTIVLYEGNPPLYSGDLESADGIYTFQIPIFGAESDSNSSNYTKPGTFKWRFIAKDISNAYSQIVEHEIIIQ